MLPAREAHPSLWCLQCSLGTTHLPDPSCPVPPGGQAEALWPRVPIITHAVRASQGPDPPRQARHSYQTGHPRGPPGHLAGAEGEGKVSASAHRLAETAQEEEDPHMQVEGRLHTAAHTGMCARAQGHGCPCGDTNFVVLSHGSLGGHRQLFSGRWCAGRRSRGSQDSVPRTWAPLVGVTLASTSTRVPAMKCGAA